MIRSELNSLINSQLPDNLQQFISAAILRGVLQDILSETILTEDGGTGYKVQYSVDGANWTDNRTTENVYYRVSNDGGSTYTGSIIDGNYLFEAITDGVSSDGNSLNKLYTFIQANTTNIANLQTAIATSPDDLQNLQDLITMLENNPTTVGEALANKLETSVYNAFLSQYATDLFSKSDKTHTHDYEEIGNLLTALSYKAEKTHSHSQSAVKSWGFYSKTEIDALINNINNNLPDIEGDDTFIRRRLNVAFYDGDFGNDQFVIKIGRTDADAVFSGGIEMSVYLHLFDAFGNFEPVNISIAGNISEGVWHNTSCGADRISNHISQVHFYHTSTDMYVLVDLFDLLGNGEAVLVRDIISKASASGALINPDSFLIETFLPESPTLDSSETIFQPVSSADLEPDTF